MKAQAFLAEQQKHGRKLPQPDIKSVSDVQTAIDLFPETNILDKNRISRPAALCLKAEALAWKYTVQRSNDKNDLTDAISALEEVEKCGVSMMDKYADIFDVANKKNSEIIFSIYLKKDEYNNMYMSTLSMSAAAGLLTNDIVNKEDIPYTNSTIARHVYAPSPRLISLFSDKDNRASSAALHHFNGAGISAVLHILFQILIKLIEILRQFF